MAQEQPQVSPVLSSETERTQDHSFNPQGWMTVSTFEIVELSREEMEHAVGARMMGKIEIDYNR